MTNTQLSEREQELLKLVATGASNKEISLRLHISVNTVKVHLRNIFGKLEVSSRTEAAMWAVQNRLIDSPDDKTTVESRESVSSSSGQRFNLLDKLPTRFQPFIYIGVVLFFVVIGYAISQVFFPPKNTPIVENSSIDPNLNETQWVRLADMVSARAGLAVAVYENQIYAIAGENEVGVIDVNERYDPLTDLWITLTPKPIPVGDVKAGIIGGQIYVPGGRLDNGDVTDSLEIYDPRTDTWSMGASLPFGLSAYAIAVFEGKLFVFGGWDGVRYLDTVFMYDPTLDTWHEKKSMPTARAFAGAAEAGGKIFVIGGFDGKGALSANEAYSPALDTNGDDPWRIYPPMPDDRYGIGVVSVTDIIYVVGGKGDIKVSSFYQFLPQQSQWEEVKGVGRESFLGLVLLETKLYALGGKNGEDIVNHQSVYQLIYTALFPIIR